MSSAVKRSSFESSFIISASLNRSTFRFTLLFVVFTLGFALFVVTVVAVVAVAVDDDGDAIDDDDDDGLNLATLTFMSNISGRFDGDDE